MSDTQRPNPSSPASLIRVEQPASHLVPPAPYAEVVGQPSRIGPEQVLFAKTVEQVTQTCRHDDPLAADDPRYQDLTRGRGDHSFAQLEDQLRRKPHARSLHLVCSSHRGAGKTTELLRLTKRLSERYLPLYIEASVEMDSNSIEIEDMLLILARLTEQMMRQRGTPLSPELLDRVNRWFADVIQTTAWGKDWSVDLAAGLKVEPTVPYFAKLLSSITSTLKVESKHREEVKAVFKKFPGTLLDSVNALLDATSERLAQEGKELLVILDNLDRYNPAVIDRLLLVNGDRIRELHCSLILTPPISLIYQPHSEPIDSYFPCEVMNSVRLRRPDQPYDQFDGPGKDLLLQALGRRIDLGRLIPDAKARDRLVIASGGAIRELLSLVSDASFQAQDSGVFTYEDIEYAVKRRKQRLRDSINSEGLAPALARIARDKQPFNDDKCRRALYLRYIFKYNGEGWYDIHPLIAELPEFQRAREQLEPST